jgi:hypothetical protein
MIQCGEKVSFAFRAIKIKAQTKTKGRNILHLQSSTGLWLEVIMNFALQIIKVALQIIKVKYTIEIFKNTAL